MIVLDNVVKRYGETTALDGVSLRVEPGSLYALLGPNGAGKTTVLRILAGLSIPTSGTASVLGHDVVSDATAVKSQIGYVPDEPAFYPRLTGREHLRLVADLRRLAAHGTMERTLELFDLAAVADRTVDSYSLGMRRKLALAAALLHRPRALLLDEPTGGLDPPGMRLVRDLLRHLCGEGVAILMTTHLLDVAERIADRIGVIAHGNLVAEGAVSELRASHDNQPLEDIYLRLTGAGTPPRFPDLWATR
ncbi:ABC transporter ATP-binding protein [Candidatus Poribacteria bacterium]|nr:ABC transporter ATP-binding protein [Candidatus Poribacteria bacterium]